MVRRSRWSVAGQLVVFNFFLVFFEQVLFKERLILPQISCLVVESAGDVGIGEETLYGEENGEDVISGRPFLAQNVQANVAVFVDVRMKARCLEADSWRSDGIPVWKFKYEPVF